MALRRSAVLSLALALALAACNQEAAQGFVVLPGSATLVVGDQLQLTAAAVAQNKLSAVTSATWTTSDAAVASVDAGGLVRAVAPGSAQITGKNGAASSVAQVTVVAAKIVGLIVSPAAASAVPGDLLRLVATASFDDGSAADVTAQAAWTSSAADVASVGSGATAGVVTAKKKGAATIAAALSGHSAQAALTVGDPRAVSLRITPAAAALPLGTNQAFTCAATFSDGSTGACPAGAWTASGDAATVSTDGTAHAAKVGTSTITYATTAGGLSASATAIVGAAAVSALAATPATLAIPLGATRAFTVKATLTDATELDVTALAAASVSSSSVASAPAPGTLKGLAPGTATATLAYGGRTASIAVTVGAPEAAALSISPAAAALPLGADQAFTCSALLSDGTSGACPAGAWSASGDAVTIAANGNAHAARLGTSTITYAAAAGGLSATAAAVVGPAAIASLAANPATLTIPLGAVRRFALNATTTDGAVLDVTSAAGLAFAPAGVAGPAGATAGVLKGLSKGATTLTLSFAGRTANVIVTVVDPEVIGYAIRPDCLVVGVGATLGLGGEGPVHGFALLSDGTSADVGGGGAFSSANPAIAAVQENLLAGVAPGLTALNLSVGGAVVATASVHSVAGVLESIEVVQPNQSVPVGSGLYLQALGHFSGGKVLDISQVSSWSVDLPEVFGSANTELPSPGQYVALRPGGPATFTVTAWGVSGQTQATATAAQPWFLAVELNPWSVPAGATSFARIWLYDTTYARTEVSASGTLSLPQGSALSLGGWTAEQGWRIDTSTAGYWMVHAEAAGLSTDFSLEVRDAALLSLRIVPAAGTPPEGAYGIPVGTEARFLALGDYSDGSTVDLTSVARWRVDDTAVFAVSNDFGRQGTVQALMQSESSSRVYAAYADQTGSLRIFADAPVPVALRVVVRGEGEMRDATVPLNQAVYPIAAIATFSDESERDVSWEADWNDTTGIWSLDEIGYLTFRGWDVGQAHAVAHYGMFTAELCIAVLPPVPTSLVVVVPPQVLPPEGALQVPAGASRQLAAIAHFGNDESWPPQDVTSLAGWSAPGGGVPVVTVGNEPGNKGLVTANGSYCDLSTVTAWYGAGWWYGSVQATLDVLVGEPEVFGLRIEPVEGHVTPATQRQFEAFLRTSAGDRYVTWDVNWELRDPAGAASLFGPGLVHGVRIGAAELVALLPGLPEGRAAVIVDPPVRALASDSNDQTRVYAALPGLGVFATTGPSGPYWQDTGLGQDATSLVVRTGFQTVYAGVDAPDGGVASDDLQADGGLAGWQPANDSDGGTIPTPNVTSISQPYDDTRGSLWAGTGTGPAELQFSYDAQLGTWSSAWRQAHLIDDSGGTPVEVWATVSAIKRFESFGWLGGGQLAATPDGPFPLWHGAGDGADFTPYSTGLSGAPRINVLGNTPNRQLAPGPGSGIPLLGLEATAGQVGLWQLNTSSSTWEPDLSFPGGLPVRAIASNSGWVPPEVYLEYVLAGTPQGVFYWDGNCGAECGWVPSSSGLTDLNVTALATWPDDARLVWAATGAGVFRSLDGGRTWEPSNAGLMADPSTLPVVKRTQGNGYSGFCARARARQRP